MAKTEAMPPAPADERKPLEVTNVRPSLVGIAGLTFKPGDTKTIPAKHEAAVRRSPLFGKVLIEGRKEMPPPLPMAKPAGLGGLEEVNALAYIALETELPLLSQWAEGESTGEKRKTVLDAIAARATVLSTK